MTTNSSSRPWGSVDRGMARLVRLVLDEAWTADSAALDLTTTVHDEAVLQVMAAQVRRAAHERPSALTHRAAETVRLAIGLAASRNGALPSRALATA